MSTSQSAIKIFGRGRTELESGRSARTGDVLLIDNGIGKATDAEIVYKMIKPEAGTSSWMVYDVITDELSLVRQHHQHRAARHVDMAAFNFTGGAGLGAYRVIDGNAALAEQLADHGLLVRRFPNGKLGLIPALDQLGPAAAALGSAL